MLSGLSPDYLCKVFGAYVMLRVEAGPFQETNHFGSLAGCLHAAKYPQAAFSLESGSQWRQTEGPNVGVPALDASVYSWGQMPWDQQEGTLCTGTHVLSLGRDGQQDV